MSLNNIKKLNFFTKNRNYQSYKYAQKIQNLKFKINENGFLFTNLASFSCLCHRMLHSPNMIL